MSIPVPCLWWPSVTITAGVNDAVVFTATAAGRSFATYSTTIAAATYSTLPDFLFAVESTLAAAERPGGITWSDDGGNVVVGLTTGGTIQIAFIGTDTGSDATINPALSSAATAFYALIGITTSRTVTESGGSAVLTGNTIVSRLWTPGVPVAFDSQDVKDYARAQSVAVGGQSYMTTHASRTKRTVRFSFVAPERTFTAREVNSGAAWETFLDSANIGRFIYYPDTSDLTTSGSYFLLLDSAEKFAPERHSAGFERYGWEIQMGAYVA